MARTESSGIEESSDHGSRETFASRFGLLMTMIGVAVGLGNVWRFPYMVGLYVGAPFVVFYILVVVLVGIPALMAEWTLGRYTRRGPVGAFERAGLPYGRAVGWFFFAVVTAATAYYTNALGWVLFYAVGEIAGAVGGSWPSSTVLPPAEGFSPASFVLQIACTGTVILLCVVVLLRGLRSGIEKASKFIIPGLLAILVVFIVRSLTLPGAGAGVAWYIGKFDLAALTGRVMMGALGQAIFTLSLGGTFMVVYGSYLNKGDNLPYNAALTALGDLTAGLLAGLAIMPAVFALGLEPDAGPGLLFFTLPKVFASIPAGWIFGLLFFLGLFGAAYLSDIAAFEVLVAGLTDNAQMKRKKAVWTMAGAVFLLSLPPMINMKVFVPWDLTFGSGMQTLGALLSVVTVAWVIRRSEGLKALSEGGAAPMLRFLYLWLRFVVPGIILLVGIWWMLTDVLGVVVD